MDLQAQFEAATIQSKSLNKRPNNDMLLKLYSLFKQATEGDVNVEKPSNPFDMVAQAKFLAWEKQKGKSNEEAMQEYVDLVETLKIQ